MTIEANNDMAAAARRIRLGMVGGGEGAFIGGVHRMAARLDGHWELVAGAFQSNPEASRTFGMGLAAMLILATFRPFPRREPELAMA